MKIKKGILALSLSASLLTGVVSGAVSAFANEDGMSRGEFVQAVVAELQIAPKSQNMILPTDVAKESPYAESVWALKERKVVFGYPDGTFLPEQAITINEATTIISRILGISHDQAEKILSEEYGIRFEGTTLSSNEAVKAIQQAFHSDAGAYQWVKESSEVQQQQSSFRSDLNQDINIVFNPNLPELNSENQMSMKSKVKMEFNVDTGIRMSMTTQLGEALPNGQTEMKMEQYIVPEGMFIQIPNPENGQLEWVKMNDAMPFTFEQLMEMQKDSAGANQALLDNKNVFYRDLGSVNKEETKTRKVAYRAHFTSLEEMMEIMGQALPNELKQQLEGTPNIEGLSIYGEMWIDETTKLPTKFFQELTLDYSYSTEQPIDKMLIKQEGNFYDFNQVEEITLPEEAEKAQPIPLAPQAN